MVVKIGANFVCFSSFQSGERKAKKLFGKERNAVKVQMRKEGLGLGKKGRGDEDEQEVIEKESEG
jgi:hypothetical protein